VTLILSELQPVEPLGTRVALTVDDVFLRNEWTDGIPTVGSSKIKPEGDLDLLGILEDMHVNATLFVCGIIAELFPDRLKEVAKRDFEIAAHGYRHENFQLLEQSEQRRRIELSLQLLEDCTGKRILGWRAPGLHANASTYKALEDTHVLYCSNIELPLFVRHVPFMYRGKVELPITVVDLRLYQSGFSPAKVRQKLLSTLHQQHETITLVVHPWVQLQNAERLRVLKDFLEAALSMEGVEFSNGFDVCRRFLSHGPSLYGMTLSAISNLWKRMSKQMQGPMSKMHQTIPRYL